MASSGAAFVFAIVAEARADQQIASELAERVLVEAVDWISVENLPDLCRWQGLDASSGYLAWKNITTIARERGIVRHEGFRQSPGAFDERRARLALRLFKSLNNRPEVVLLVRDTDGEPAQVSSLERVRTAGSWEFEVLLATPDPKRECWVLAGFDPMGDKEAAVIEKVQSLLGFDPRTHAERLTAQGKKGKRNAKKILAQLLSPESEREQACWQQADLNLLKERGQKTRLTAFLEEISTRLVPLLAGRV